MNILTACHTRHRAGALALAIFAGLAIPAVTSAAGLPSPAENPAPQASKASAVFTVNGTVIDSTGEPVIGATVSEKGNPGNGVATDIDGNFSLRVKSPKVQLQVSYVGMETETVNVNGQSSLTIRMRDAEGTNLQDLVVVGFGTQKKVNLTGSVGVATSKDIEGRPVQNATAALQGVIPGLNISNSTSGGELNASKQISVRGMNTIGDGSKGGPLILIDGMEGSLDALNPNDIENISVLKDAAASSIYGSRAPFGVILVTTKSGTSGKAKIQYSGSFRFNQPLTPMQMMDSWEFINYTNDVERYTSPGSQRYSDDFVEQAYEYYTGQRDNPFYENKWKGDSRIWGDGAGSDGRSVFANVNWRDELYKKTAFAHEHNVTLTGGKEKVNYYVSGNFLDQSGFLKYGNDKYDRFSLMGKINAQMFKWLNLQYTGRWIRTDYSRPTIVDNGFYEKVIRRLPAVNPKYDPNGYIAADYNYIEHLSNGGRRKEQNDAFTNQVKLTITPLEGWNIMGEFNSRVNNDWTHQDRKPVYAHDADDLEGLSSETTHVAFDSPDHSSVYEYSYRSTYLNYNVYTDYNFTVADKNDFKVMLGFQAEDFKYRNLNASRDDMTLEDLPVLNLTNSTKTYGMGSEYQKWRTVGFFGRINYNFDSRYLVEVNLRYDGTSRFRSKSRWVWSPSFSLGWNLDREAFWEPIASWWNAMKIRASYGQLANQNTNNWYPTYRTVDVKAQDSNWLVNGLKPTTSAFPALIYPALTWEKIRTTNLGVDFGFFSNRLNGSFDYFWRDNSDMVGPATTYPAVFGATVPKQNNLAMRTFGWELTIGWQDVVSDFHYSVKFNVSDDQTKITKYPNPEKKIDYQNMNTYIADVLTGNIYGFTTHGIAQTDEEMQAWLAHTNQDQIGSNWQAGDIMYVDINHDGKITKGTTLDDLGDLKVIGNNTPRFRFGLNLYGEWKGIDLTLFFQGVGKRDYYFGPYGGQGTAGKGAVFWGATTGGFSESIFLKEHLDYWRDENSRLGENRDAYYARPLYYTNKNREMQTRYLQDASYIRLKNLQVGYTLPKEWTRKFYCEKLRVYFSAENLWTGTKMSKVIDPESLEVSSMKSGSSYPIAKTFSFGLTLDF